MKTNLLILFLLLAATCAHAQKIELSVIDDVTGLSVEGAQAVVIYDNPASPKRFDEQTKLTDDEGEVEFRGTGKLGASLRLSQDGYYDFGKVSGDDDFRFVPKDLKGGVKKTVRLRPILSPAALYAKQTQPLRHNPDGVTIIPELNEWYGYDFEAGDWIAPHGSGKKADVLFHYQREFVGFDEQYWQRTLEQRREFSKKAFAARGEEWTEEKFRLRSGDWNMRLEIAFPGEKEGLLKVANEFNPYSHLRMPHLAPEEGYEASYQYAFNNYEPYALRDDLGFFLRTRVVLDSQGNIESANYAKVHGDFKATVDGKLSFAYYFNPVPNDRNLELDPKQNLFPEGTPGTFNFVLP